MSKSSKKKVNSSSKPDQNDPFKLVSKDSTGEKGKKDSAKKPAEPDPFKLVSKSSARDTDGFDSVFSSSGTDSTGSTLFPSEPFYYPDPYSAPLGRTGSSSSSTKTKNKYPTPYLSDPYGGSGFDPYDGGGSDPYGIMSTSSRFTVYRDPSTTTPGSKSSDIPKYSSPSYRASSSDSSSSSTSSSSSSSGDDRSSSSRASSSDSSSSSTSSSSSGAGDGRSSSSSTGAGHSTEAITPPAAPEDPDFADLRASMATFSVDEVEAVPAKTKTGKQSRPSKLDGEDFIDLAGQLDSDEVNLLDSDFNDMSIGSGRSKKTSKPGSSSASSSSHTDSSASSKSSTESDSAGITLSTSSPFYFSGISSIPDDTDQVSTGFGLKPSSFTGFSTGTSKGKKGSKPIYPSSVDSVGDIDSSWFASTPSSVYDPYGLYKPPSKTSFQHDPIDYGDESASFSPDSSSSRRSNSNSSSSSSSSPSSGSGTSSNLSSGASSSSSSDKRPTDPSSKHSTSSGSLNSSSTGSSFGKKTLGDSTPFSLGSYPLFNDPRYSSWLGEKEPSSKPSKDKPATSSKDTAGLRPFIDIVLASKDTSHDHSRDELGALPEDDMNDL